MVEIRSISPSAASMARRASRASGVGSGGERRVPQILEGLAGVAIQVAGVPALDGEVAQLRLRFDIIPE